MPTSRWIAFIGAHSPMSSSARHHAKRVQIVGIDERPVEIEEYAGAEFAHPKPLPTAGDAHTSRVSRSRALGYGPA